MSVSSHGDSVSETSGSDNSSVVHVRDNSGGVTVEGLGLSLPLAVDGIYTVVDNWGDSMHSSVGESSNLGQTVSVVNMGDGTSISLASQNLSDGVRLRLSLSLPLSIDYGVGISNVGDSSVREASHSSNPGIADTSDNTTSSAASQHLSDGVGIRLAADGYSKEHCEEGTHGEC